jgi:hypothetical protein
MTLLAYDPAAVGRLQVALRAALDDLRRVACHDPAAATTIRLVRSAASQIETIWLPLADRLLATDPLSKGLRRDAGIGSLQQSLINVMAQGYGWSVQTDPLADDASVVTTEEARALGAMLDQAQPRALAGDPATQRWLAGQLAIIGADPMLSREFLANFDNWAPLCNWLAWAHLRSSGGDPSQADPAAAEQLNDVIDGLAAIQWQAMVAAGNPGSIRSASAAVPQLGAMQPYAAALLVSNMPITGDALVTVAIDLLQRYLDQPMTAGVDGPWGDKDFDHGPRTADLLLPLILCDRGTTIAFVHAAVAANPLLLFATAADQGLAHAAMLVAVDPRHSTSEDVADVIAPLLHGFNDGTIDIGSYGFDPEWHRFLAALVAPWLLAVTDADDDTWGMALDERAQLLGFVMQDDHAMDELLEQSDAIVAGLASQTSFAKMTEVEAAAVMLGVVLQLFVNEATRTEEISQAQWDLLWTVGGAIAGALTGGIVAGVAMDGGVFIGQQLSEASGWLGAPNVRDATLTAALARKVVLTTTAAALTSSRVAQLIRTGQLPRTIEPFPVPVLEGETLDADYRTAYADWKARNGIVAESETDLQLNAVFDSFLSPSSVGEHSA